MNCKKCGGKLTVVDTKELDDVVYRRRKCKVCGKSVYTSELEDSKELYCEARNAAEKLRRERMNKDEMRSK